MSSIRKRTIGILWLGCGVMLPLCACKTQPPAQTTQAKLESPPPAPLNRTPLTIDGAMQIRDWEPTAAYYANDVVMAGPTYAPFESRTFAWPEDAITEPIQFLANVVCVPIGLCVDPPTEWVGYKSLLGEPTYTAMPPLPPAAETVPGYVWK